MPTTASVCNRVFLQFISRLPHARSELLPPSDSLEDFISRGLEILADIADDPSIAQRDPFSPMSFSRISVSVQRLQVENYMAAARDAKKAFSPLGSDGRPMRKSVGGRVLCCPQWTDCYLTGTRSGNMTTGSKATGVGCRMSVRTHNHCV